MKKNNPQTTDPDPITNLDKVVEFARQNGFPDAIQLYWDVDASEAGHTDMGMIMDYMEPGTIVRISLGIQLTQDGLKARVLDDDDSDYEAWEWVI